MKYEEIIKVATLENEIEAKLLAAVLEDKGIPHIIGSYHDAAYDGIFQIQRGWGYINAPASYKNEILEIISDIKKSHYPEE